MMVTAEVGRVSWKTNIGRVTYTGKANSKGVVTFKRVKVKSIYFQRGRMYIVYTYLNNRPAFKRSFRTGIRRKSLK